MVAGYYGMVSSRRVDGILQGPRLGGVVQCATRLKRFILDPDDCDACTNEAAAEADEDADNATDDQRCADRCEHHLLTAGVAHEIHQSACSEDSTCNARK